MMDAPEKDDDLRREFFTVLSVTFCGVALMVIIIITFLPISAPLNSSTISNLSFELRKISSQVNYINDVITYTTLDQENSLNSQGRTPTVSLSILNSRVRHLEETLSTNPRRLTSFALLEQRVDHLYKTTIGEMTSVHSAIRTAEEQRRWSIAIVVSLALANLGLTIALFSLWAPRKRERD